MQSKPTGIKHSDERPMVPIAYGRNKNGDIDKVRLVPAVPGTVIHRCGRAYVLDATGTQHRVK